MRYAIVIPTYNERENIRELVRKILSLKLNTFIVIVDDNSPDGTGELADKLNQEHSEVRVIHRTKKEGLGLAYVAGLKYALELGAEKIMTMDADFSHNPDDIPRILKESEKYDLVIGSRYTSGGGILNWEWWRRLLSWGGGTIGKVLLGLRIKDCTTGFKCYDRKFLESLNLNQISSQGYAFLIETSFLAQSRGFSILEMPIIFEERKEGKSKVGFGEILKFAQDILRLTFHRFIKK